MRDGSRTPGAVPASTPQVAPARAVGAVAAGVPGPRARRDGAGPAAEAAGATRTRASVPATLRSALEAVGRFLRSPLAPYRMLLATTGLLVLFGTVAVLSAAVPDALRRYGWSQYTGLRQIIYVVLAFAAFMVCSRLPVPLLRRLAPVLLVVSIVLLVAVLIPGIGKYQSGARRWIYLGPLTFQPSELAKIGLALWGADLLARKQRLLDRPKHVLVPLVPVSLLIFVLIMLEPDLGTTMSTALVVFGLLWVVGVPLRYFGGAVAIAAVCALILGMAAPYRMRRLAGFLDPWSDTGDLGYQAVQSLLAIAGGGVSGQGLGNGDAKWLWLPNAHTDFVFAVVAEELGLLGVGLLLALFVALLFSLARIARDTGRPFVRLFVAAVAFWFAGQALLNLGAVTGLLPITGIPLPLISFGGTALISKVAVLGMVAAMARSEPVVVQARARRRAARTRARQARRAGEGVSVS